MKLTSDSLIDSKAMPLRCAFAVAEPNNHVRWGPNRNPHLAWSHVPQDARSLVLICLDPDFPNRVNESNREDAMVPPDAPRTTFFHWLMVDIPPALDHLDEGDCADGVVIGGKEDPAGPAGTRQGINAFTEFFARNSEMAGTYRGYDGPYPPRQDSIPHRYRFCLYATDLDHCPVDDDFTGPDVVQAIQGHVVAEAVLTGIYSLNPQVEAR